LYVAPIKTAPATPERFKAQRMIALVDDLHDLS
jgi:hypothetical protein